MGFSLKTVLLRLVQGFIIGAGGILPGISGGVLSVIFGIYRPVMEVLAHPLNGLRRHLSLLLPVGAGAILGFLCGGGLILVLFDRSEKLATCLFIGLILGLTLGSIPIAVPGVSIPVKLGLAGGPIIVGILIGTFGPRMHMITYTTQSANLMLRALGLSMYLACLGLDAGAHFFETVMRPEGILWLGVGFVLTFVPVVMVGLPAMRLLKVDFGSVAGLLCGSMANPMALNYANDTIEGDNPSVSYATVYPVCMFLRVIVIQITLMLFI